MKIFTFVAAIISALSLSLPSQADFSLQMTSPNLSKWTDFKYPVFLKFERAMIPLSEVGKEVKPGLLIFDPKIDYRAVWDSPVSLELTFPKGLPFRQKVSLSLAPDASYVDGGKDGLDVRKQLPNFDEVLAVAFCNGSQQMRWNELNSEKPIYFFVGKDNVNFEQSYLERKNGAQWERPEKINYKIRQLTYGELKKDKDLFKAFTFWASTAGLDPDVGVSLKDQDPALCYRMDLGPRSELFDDVDFRLTIPKMGKLSSDQKKYNDAYIGIGRGPSLLLDSMTDQSGDIPSYLLQWREPVSIENIDEWVKKNLVFSLEAAKTTLSYDNARKVFTGQVVDQKTGKPIQIDVSYRLTNDPDKNNAEGIRSLSFQVTPSDFMDELLLTGKSSDTCLERALLRNKFQWDLNRMNHDAAINLGNNGVMSPRSKSVLTSVSGIDKITYHTYRIKPSDEKSEAYDALAYALYHKKYEANEYGSDKIQDYLVSPNQLTVGESYELVKIPDTQGKNGKYETIRLSLDDLVGGSAPTGMYFIDVESSLSPESLRSVKYYGSQSSVSKPMQGTEDKYIKDCDKNVKKIVTQSLVQLTNLGLLCKLSGSDGFFYVYALSTGEPIKHARLSFINKEGRVLSSHQVNDGVYQGKLPQGTVFVRCSELSTDNKVIDQYISYIYDYNQSPGIDLYSYDIPTYNTAWIKFGVNPKDWNMPKVFMFSDRTLYRPGESMHLKGIVRDLKDTKLSLPQAKTLTIVIKDVSRNQDEWTETVPIDSNGTFHIDYKFPPVKTGRYVINAVLNDVDVPNLSQLSGEQISQWHQDSINRQLTNFSYIVNVQEFKRNEFEIESTIAVGKPGDNVIDMSVAAKNFSGVPVSEGAVTWNKTELPHNFYPEGYKDYFFGDHSIYDPRYWNAYYGYGLYDDESGATLDLLKDVLDKNGKRSREWKLSANNPLSIKDVTIDTYVTNLNQQRLRKSQKTVYYPSNVFVGVKSKDVINPQDTKFDLSFVGITPEGKVYDQGDLDLTVKVKRQDFQTVRNFNDDGSYVESTPEWHDVSAENVVLTPQESLSKDAVNYSFIAKQPGIYDVEVSGTDKEGHPFATKIRRWVYGEGQSPWEYRDGLGLDIVADKKIYSPGETAKLLLMTPIDAELMLTVERNGVIKSFQQKVTVENPVIEIPIEDGYAPNVYVSAFLVKGADYNKRVVKNPQLKLGYACLNVNPDQKKLTVTLEPPTSWTKPGEKIQVKGSVKDSNGQVVPRANVCLYAVDEGTLQVGGYNLPKPFDRFYASIPLAVNTWTTLGQLLTEESDYGTFVNKGIYVGGGGDSDDESSAFLKIRTNFDPLAIWLADINTDDQGQFNASYINPDLLTRYRVMAVVVEGADRFGSGESSYTVNKPIMLEPADPMLACVGDDLNIPVTISQTLDRKGLWEVRLKGSETVSISEPVQYVELNGKEPKSLEFNVSMKEQGEAQLTWSIYPVNEEKQVITSGPESKWIDAVESKFELVVPLPEIREQYSFTLNSKFETDMDHVFKTKFLDGASIDWYLSCSPFIYSTHSWQYLLRYPYGCLEQLSSCLWPWLFEPEFKEYIPGFSAQTALYSRKDCINDGVAKILVNQLSSGGLSYWPGSYQESEYTPYAAMVLTKAKQEGFQVPQEALDKLYEFMVSQLVSGKTNDMLYALALSEAGKLNESLINQILDKNEFQSLTDKLYFIMALAQKSEPAYKKKAKELFDKQNFDHYTDTTKYLIAKILLDDVASTRSTISDYFREQMAQRNSHFYTTQSTSWDLILLSYYLKDFPKPTQDAQVIVQINDASKDISCTNQKVSTLKTKLGDYISMRLSQNNDIVYGYGIASGKADMQNLNQTIDHGIKVDRVYDKMKSDGTWENTATFNVGDIVRVTLSGERQNVNSPFHYIVAEDYAPSTFEVLNPALPSQYFSVPESTYDNISLNHREYLKDRVRFFANVWSSANFSVNYYARVVKSGKVTAPAAKVELMYQPNIYGLSIPIRFNIPSEAAKKNNQ